MRILRFLALAAVFLPASVPSAHATTMRHLDTRSLSAGSSEIVVATVEATRARWSADHKKIFTDVDLKIAESLKGGAADRLTLTQLGGELDGIRYSVQGGPLFRTGEEAVVFVWRDAHGAAQVNGMAQGKFDIQRDAKGIATVQRTVPGFAVKDVKNLAAVQDGRPAPRLTLDDLKSEIRRALQQQPEDGR